VAAPDLNRVIMIIIILAAVFIFSAALVLPFFAGIYEYGMGSVPCNKDSSCTAASTNTVNGYCQATSGLAACANCNISTGYSTFLGSCHSLISWLNNTHCNACTNFGFKTSATGMMLFLLFIGLLSLVILFIMKALPKFK